MFLLEILSVFALFHTIRGQCLYYDDNYIGDLCYMIPTQKLNYVDAREFCNKKAYNLAVIHTASQASFVSSLVRTKADVTGANFWIGLSRASVGSQYQWDDGTALSWSNFDPKFPQDDLFVAESTINAKWQVLDGEQLLFFACSYDPKLVTPDPPAPTTTSKTDAPQQTTRVTSAPSVSAKNVTCLMMFDGQSLGNSHEAILTYLTYFNFAKTVGNMIEQVAKFSGNIDNFGYGVEVDHEFYLALDRSDFNALHSPFMYFGNNIVFDLKEVSERLKSAVWVNPTEPHTCLVFISAAMESEYQGTAIQNSYPAFETVVGVLVGNATVIPGLSSVVNAADLSDADAHQVVNMIFSTLK